MVPLFRPFYTRQIMANYTIRKLRKEDCPRLYEMICAHSAFDGFPVTNTIEALEKDGFGEHKSYECLVAEITIEGEDKGKLVGHCMFYMTYAGIDGKTIFLEDYFVVESYRNKGIGTAMWNEFCQVAVEREVVGLYFNVLKKNSYAIDFYKAKGCFDLTEKSGFLTFTLNGPGLKAHAKKS